VAALLPLYSDLEGDEFVKLSGGAPVDEPMSAHAEVLAPALGIPPEELAVLVDDAAAQKLGLDEAPVPDSLSFGNLSRLYRRVILGRAAGLPMPDLLVLLALTKIAPFDRDRVDEAVRLVAFAEKLRAAGLTVAELDDLMRGSGARDPGDEAALEALRGVLRELRDQGKEADAPGAILDWLGATLAVDRPVAAAFAIEHFVTALQEGGEAAAGALRKLRRAAFLIAKLNLAPDAAWLVKHGGDLGIPDLESLPESTVSFDDAAQRVTAFERLLDTCQVRAALPPGGLIAVLDPAIESDDENARGACFAALGQRLSWPVAEIAAVAAGLGLSFPRDFRDARTIGRLLACHALRRRAGVDAARLLGWRASPLTLAAADDIVAAVRAHTDPTALAPLETAVRAARRSALVAHLLHTRGMTDAGALSEHFLVDVTADDADPISRIEHATASVQRFIQRCLLGLEHAVSLTPDDVRRWRMVHDFKVWREARRIVLHPENHLGVLRERTPFFAAFERDLAAGPEDAVRRYLEQLDGVARLEIVGLYEDDGGALHLCGRAAGTKQHYYRRRAGDDWGPWEPIGADIESADVLPIAWDGRVVLLWPVRANGTVKMAWSERMAGGWSAGRVSADAVATGGAAHLAFRTRFTADGEPVVSVLADAPAGPALPGAPSIGAARAVNAAVLGSFRFARRGPMSTDSDRRTETLLHPRPSTRQLRLAREDGIDVLVLRRTPSRQRVTLPHVAGALSPIVYDDGERTFLATLTGAADIPWREAQKWMPWHVDVAMQAPWPGVSGGGPVSTRRLFPRPELGVYHFERLYHPFGTELLRRLGRDGIDGVFAPEAQDSVRFSFDTSYDPMPAVVDEFRPVDRIAYTAGPYAQYQWELFLHAPLAAARRLMADKRFDEAQRWLHFIFDPSDAQRQCWRLPFRAVLGLEGWLREPKDPHRVARARSGAYQRAVVMAYLDNLIAWGDHLHAGHQNEAAALMYRAAGEILGPRPVPAPAQGSEAPSFNELIRAKANVLATIENLLPRGADDRVAKIGDGIEAILAPARTLTSFCVPANDVLTGYWDTITERLKHLS
jgi:hypothetical protein